MKVPIPTNKKLMDPTIDAIGKLGGSASNSEIADQIIKDLELPPEIASDPLLKKNMGWARTYLKRQGLIHNSASGIWTLTAGPPRVVQNYLEKAKEDVLAASSWQEMLMRILQDMPPEVFERLCQRLLRERGFEEVTITGRSGDGAS